MKIGITYDLRTDYVHEGITEEAAAEFDRSDTIDAIDNALKTNGYQTDRIGNARSLIQRIASGDRWDLVFNIAEGLHGMGREAQVPAILDVYDIPYTFSDPVVLGIALHKGFTKNIIRDAGLPTPAFAVIDEPADARAVNIPFPLFVKPIAEGTGKGITSASKVGDKSALTALCARLLRKYKQPVLVEEYLPGREFTVGLLGTGKDAAAIGALNVALNPGADANAYGYLNKEKCEELVKYSLAVGPEADEACRVALQCWRVLGCRDAGRIDLRADKHGKINFLEVNPLAGLHPTHSDLPMLCTAVGIRYEELIGRIVESAARRAGLKKRARASKRRGVA